MCKRAGTFLFGCILVGAVGAIVLVAMYGSVRAGFARLNGSELLLLPDKVDVANHAEDGDGTVAGHFTIKNLTGRSIMVSGARVDCGCVSVTSPLPFSLMSGEEKQVEFTFEPSSGGSPTSQSIVLYTDSRADPELVAVVSSAGQE